MYEEFTTKDQVLITLASSLLEAACALSWFIPGEWLYGCSVWAVTGVLVGMTVLFWAGKLALRFIAMLAKAICEYRREKEEPEQIIGFRHYISRETVCRAAGGRR